MIEEGLLILGLGRSSPQALRQVYDKSKVALLRPAVVVAHDFERDIAAEASDFMPVIPADCTPGRPMMPLGPKK